MERLDMTGNPCPIPVIKAKKELEKPDSSGVIVLVDNIVAVQNLQKMADGLGYTISSIPDEDSFLVTIGKSDGTAPATADSPAEPVQEEKGVTVLLTSNQIGSGSEELGAILAKGFLFSLTELVPAPRAVVFMNSGVRLACEGSNALDDLKALAEKGVAILACGTCLNYYSLTDKLAVGEVVNMFAITEQLASAEKLISL